MSIMEVNQRFVMIKTYIAPVDINVTLDELKEFLFKDNAVLKFERTLKLSLLLSKSGQSLGYAFMNISTTKVKKLFRKNGSKLRGKTFTISPSENVHIPKEGEWKTEEVGVYKATPPILAPSTTVTNSNKYIPFCYDMIDCGSLLVQDIRLDYCINEVLARAVKCGVEKIVLKSFSVKEARKAQRLSKLFPGLIYYTVECDQQKDFTLDANILSIKEEKVFRDVTEDNNMKALKITIRPPISATTPPSQSKEYEHWLKLLEYQIQCAVVLKKPVFIDHRVWYGSVPFKPGFVDNLFKIFDSFEDKLPRIAVSSDLLSERDLNRLVERDYYVIITGYSWSTEATGSPIGGWLSNLQEKYLNKILVASGFVHPKILRSFRTQLSRNKSLNPEELRTLTDNALDVLEEYIDDSKVPRNNQAGVRVGSYMHDRLFIDAVQSIVMPCLIELIAANIKHKTPTQFAKITKDNAETFYCFKDVQETSRVLKEPCVGSFQDLPPCDQLFWIIFGTIVFLYIHVIFVIPYYPDVYILW